MSDLEKLVSAALDRERAAIWDQGFYAGQQHGQAYERHDPQWDREYAPEPPRNPYRREQRT